MTHVVRRGYLRGLVLPELVECPLCERQFGRGYYERYHRDDLHRECSCGRWFVAVQVHVVATRRHHPSEPGHLSTGRRRRPRDP